MFRRAYSCAVVAGAIVTWFMIFPDDLAFFERLLMQTQQVAGGAWALLIAVVLVAGAVRISGRHSIGSNKS